MDEEALRSASFLACPDQGMTHDASASVTIKVTGQRVLNEEVCMVCTVTVDFEEEVDWPQEAESARTTAAPELALESLRS
ncbi:MAG: hypothetical protein ACI841_003357, partial [Planctomycetota bacterium]